MSKRVIDVSSYQGSINWQRVKASGIEGAILKIIRKDLNADKQFEINWKGCKAAGIPIVGVYNYSYATTEAKSIYDAQKVVSVLAGRKAKVWLDIEDSCQKGLGMPLINIIRSYHKIIESAGLEFGVYTGLSFYNTHIKPYASLINCNFWIARYPSSKTMAVSENPATSKQPAIKHTLEGWQYSSKGQVPGINGNVDMNLWYGDVVNGNIPSAENPYLVPTRILRLKTIKMRGNDVAWVQYHLVRLGFLPPKNSKGKTNIDGIFGKDTDYAVRASQRRYGITVDGIVGANTKYVLQAN